MMCGEASKRSRKISATTKVKTNVMHNVDLELLRRHRYTGTTTNWAARRTDLCEGRWLVDGTSV